MNQILYVGKDNKSVNINKVIRFFAIFIILFAICLIANGSYGMYQTAQYSSAENIPTVYMDRVSDEVILRVEDNIPISELIYSWNKGEKTILLPNSKIVEERIPLLNENCVLNIQVVDKRGKKTDFKQEWNIEGLDIQKPTIEVQTDERQQTIIIYAKDETEMSYITYKWNDEEPKKVYVSRTNKLEIQKQIDMQIGENVLEIEAVDSSGNTAKENKKIIISSAPKIKLTKNDDKLHIVIEDEIGLQSVEVNVNGKIYKGEDINKNLLKLKITLSRGNNVISIKAVNKNGIEGKDIKEIEYIP